MNKVNKVSKDSKDSNHENALKWIRMNKRMSEIELEIIKMKAEALKKESEIKGLLLKLGEKL